MSTQNVSKPNKPQQKTRLRNFIGSGGKIQNFESCKGIEKAKSGTKK